MDLATGARKVIALMNHCEKSGASKIVETCTLPLTALRCVNLVITDVGVFDPVGAAFRVVELAPGIAREDLGADVPLC
jgi:3-oxoacid CoA-transferase subunit B